MERLPARVDDTDVLLVFESSCLCTNEEPVIKMTPSDTLADGWNCLPMCEVCGSDYHFSHTVVYYWTISPSR